jgi:hypothetical protein
MLFSNPPEAWTKNRLFSAADYSEIEAVHKNKGT